MTVRERNEAQTAVVTNALVDALPKIATALGLAQPTEQPVKPVVTVDDKKEACLLFLNSYPTNLTAYYRQKCKLRALTNAEFRDNILILRKTNDVSLMLEYFADELRIRSDV